MAEFPRVLSESTTRGSNNIPGCVIAAVNRNGDKFYSASSGYESVAPGAPEISPDGVFFIASCSKLIGTIAALQCVERGQISLDEPVERILPELANLPIIKPVEAGDDSGNQEFKLEPSTKKITLRQLLTHTSGLGYDRSYPLVGAWRTSRQEDLLALSGKLVKAYATPLLFEPGEGWAYGGGIDVSTGFRYMSSLWIMGKPGLSMVARVMAGELVARLNKVTLEEYLQTHIFGPLDMKSTTFRIENRPELEQRLVKATLRSGNGILIESARLWPIPAAEDCAGVGLYSTSDDYLKVLGDLIREKPILLKGDTVKTMFSPQIARGSPALHDLQSASITAAMTGVTEGLDRVNWGLGGIYYEEDLGANKKGSLLWGGFPNLLWFAHPSSGVAGLYASQVLPPLDPKSLELGYQFIDHVWQTK